MIFDTDRQRGESDVGVLAVKSDRTADAVLDAELVEEVQALSPDGRWLAYESDESSEDEIFVRLFPNIDGGKWRFFTDLSTAPEAAESARDRGQSELVAPWPTSVSAAASVHRACLARGEGRP